MGERPTRSTGGDPPDQRAVTHLINGRATHPINGRANLQINGPVTHPINGCGTGGLPLSELDGAALFAAHQAGEADNGAGLRPPGGKLAQQGAGIDGVGRQERGRMVILNPAYTIVE